MVLEISTPPSAQWDQGDIVERIYFPSVDDKLPAVLMTPACDIDNDKVSVWTFVGLFPAVDVARDVARPEIMGFGLTPSQTGRVLVSKSQERQLRKLFEGLVKNRIGRFHFLPIVIGEEPAHVVDFTHVTSIPILEAQASPRVCSLLSSWKEQLAARYVAYMGRIGTVDPSSAEVTSHVDRLAAALIET